MTITGLPCLLDPCSLYGLPVPRPSRAVPADITHYSGPVRRRLRRQAARIAAKHGGSVVRWTA